MIETHTVSYVLTPSAMTDATRLHQSQFLARYRAVMVLVAVVGVVLAIVFDQSIGVTVAIFGLLLLAMTWMQFVDRRLARSRGRGFVGGEVEYVLDDAGIHYHVPVASGVIPWSALTKVRANDRSIVFSRERALVAWVPVTAFRSATERDAFLAFAQAHVGGVVTSV